MLKLRYVNHAIAAQIASWAEDPVNDLSDPASLFKYAQDNDYGELIVVFTKGEWPYLSNNFDTVREAYNIPQFENWREAKEYADEQTREYRKKLAIKQAQISDIRAAMEADSERIRQRVERGQRAARAA